MAATKGITIQQGRTFALALRWEAPPIVYKAITAIPQSAPARLTVIGHGVPDGWRVAVTSVKGMTEINAESDIDELRDRDYHSATVVDVDTIELNKVNAAGFKPYVSGGYLQYNTPVPLAGYTARMNIKDKVGGTVLLDLTTENSGIAIDTALHTITLNIAATATALIKWRTAVYDLELINGLVVTALLSGSVSVTKEVTT